MRDSSPSSSVPLPDTTPSAPPPPPSRAATYEKYTVGVDLGRNVDPTAISVIGKDFPPGARRPCFTVGYLQRLPLRTSYPAVRAKVRQLMAKPKLKGAELVIDATGVGMPVCDEFDSDGLRPIKVMITAGSEATRDDKDSRLWRVAKSLLISHVSSLLNERRLQVSAQLKEADILKHEFFDFEASMTDSGRWTFGAREGKHDDLLLAVAIALWRASDDAAGWMRNITPQVLDAMSRPYGRPMPVSFRRDDRA